MKAINLSIYSKAQINQASVYFDWCKGSGYETVYYLYQDDPNNLLVVLGSGLPIYINRLGESKEYRPYN